MSGLTFVNTVSNVMNSVFEFSKTMTDSSAKQKFNQIYDQLMELKHQANALADENRELREKLRFKSDDFEFRQPFYYDTKKQPQQPLCPKCFSEGKTAPMSQQKKDSAGGTYRVCLVCTKTTHETYGEQRSFSTLPKGGGGPDSWMG